MSDRDPLEQLASFGTGGPVDPLPAAEVRRLGDRRRARRTAVSAVAGVAAVLAVVVPTGLYAARDGAGTPDPPAATNSSTPTLTPEDRLPTAIGLGDIPADFPLNLGTVELDQDEQAGPAAGVSVEPPDLCGTKGLGAARATGRMAFSHTASEFVEERELRTYPDAATAVAVVDRLRQDVAACHGYENADGIHMGVLPITVKTGYDSVMFAQTSEPYGVGYLVTRVGRAVLVLRLGGEWTVDALPTTAADEATKLTRRIASHLCLFTEAGCGDGGDDGLARTVPAGFPLDAALGEPPVNSQEVTVDGPSSRAHGVDPATICTHPLAIPHVSARPRDVSDVLHYGVMGMESDERRTLWVFTSVRAAADQMAALRTQVSACQRDREEDGLADRLWRSFTTDTGTEDSLSFGWTHEAVSDVGAPSGSLYTVARVGSAIVALARSQNPYGATAMPGDARAQAEVVQLITPAMCVFTSEGCSENTATDAAAGPCAKADLEVVRDPAGAAMSHFVWDIRIKQVGAGACTLPDAVSAQFLLDGRPVASPARLAIPAGTTLRRNEKAHAALQVTSTDPFDRSDCQPAPVDGLRIGFVTAGQLRWSYDLPAQDQEKACRSGRNLLTFLTWGSA